MHYFADYSMSQETVIVGDRSGEFLGGDDFMDKKSKMKCQPLSIAAIALLFMRDRNKPYGTAYIPIINQELMYVLIRRFKHL